MAYPQMVWTILGMLLAAAFALGLVEIVHRAIVRMARRSAAFSELAAHSHRPFQIFSALFAMRTVLALSPLRFDWRAGVLHLSAIALIGVGAWLLATMLIAMEDAAESRFRIDVPDNRRARRVRTQVAMMRRVTIAAVVVLALGLSLMTFPQVRALGASLLASAGVIGIVAAVAAQSTLSNVFAGMQLAFSDAIRIDDVVVMEGEWARVEEITLTHVVLHIWDERRLILPTAYFVTKPFQNWTRTQSRVLGTVEFDLDWTVQVPRLRDELRKVTESSDLWDGRVCVLQVTDAVRGTVRLRALVSAADGPSLWDLRCLVREHLVAWIRDQQPLAIPRTRAELSGPDDERPKRPVRPTPGSEENSRLYSGSDDADARAQTFHGPTIA
ncbi:mechanosensitive ion channel family protein [Catelliglobosispora koreensis]|uniref:mechanosensitive ion channel family protein n=1 Tax=Catelliglobosispora koreensis TaxID=129052 RepID=UPI001FE0C1FB|nr:mechanosensitive ion channel domain-containing protein [Catelliglobosispora koreensis]